MSARNAMTWAAVAGAALALTATLLSCEAKAEEIVMLPNIPVPEGSSLRFCFYKGNGFVVWVERNGDCPSWHPWPLVWADPSHIPAAMVVEELPR